MNQEQEESTETLDHIQDPPATPSQADTDKNPEEILDSVGILVRRNPIGILVMSNISEESQTHWNLAGNLMEARIL